MPNLADDTRGPLTKGCGRRAKRCGRRSFCLMNLIPPSLPLAPQPAVGPGPLFALHEPLDQFEVDRGAVHLGDRMDSAKPNCSCC